MNGAAPSPFAVFDASSAATMGSNGDRQTKLPERRPVEQPPLATTAVTQNLQNAEKANPFQLAAEPVANAQVFQPVAASAPAAPQNLEASPFSTVGKPSSEDSAAALQRTVPLPSSQPRAPQTLPATPSQQAAPSIFSAPSSMGASATPAEIPPQPRETPGALSPESPKAKEVATPTPAPPATAESAAPAEPRQKPQGLNQLEIRAIFGVEHELKDSELLQRARTLNGVRNVAVIQADKAAAFEAVRSSIQSLGFGDADTLELAVEGGSIDFVQHGGVTLVVLHEGTYAPGVRETLMIVAREIGRLKSEA